MPGAAQATTSGPASAAKRSLSIAADHPGCGKITLGHAVGVIRRDLDEYDAYAVRILDPHLDKPPRLRLGFTRDLHFRRHETFVLGPYVADLQPDPKRSGRLVVGSAGYLKQSLAKEEDQPWILRWPELTADRESKNVPVETATELWVGRA